MDEYCEFINNEWKNIKEFSQILSAESQEKQAEHHNSKKRIKKYEIGQLVLKEIPQRSGKLEPRYEGPYKIISKIGETTYKIKQIETNEILRVHGSQIKLYNSNDEKKDSNKEYNRKRTRKKEVNSISSTLLWTSLLFILIQLIVGEEYGYPLLWRETDHKFLKGRQIVNYTINLVNPCIKISDPNNTVE
jgi:hypothetical protein